MKLPISIRLPCINYRFQPEAVPTLACLVLCAALISLGHWQWQRAIFKEKLYAQYSIATQAPTPPLDLIETMGHEAQGLSITLTGVFDNNHTLLLDNQMHGQQAGVHVLTFFRTNAGKILLVNRGWMPMRTGTLGGMRQPPVVPATLDGEMMIRGFVYFPSEKQIVLEHDDYSNPVWPLLVQKLDMPAIASAIARSYTGVELPPFVIRLHPDVMVERNQQMPRYWQLMTMPPEKHRAYAFQWYGLALTLMILYVVFSCKKVVST